MPSPEARRLTLSHREQVLRLAGLIARRLRTTALAADAENIDDWWDSISARVREEILTGQSALAQLARRYLVAHAAAEGVTLEPVRVVPNVEQIETALRVTGPVAFKTHMAATGSAPGAARVMAETLSGAAQRLVLRGDRDTLMRTFRERDEMAGWRRTGGSCPFCLMLVGRGAVYSKQSVEFRAHDHCRCGAEPLYRREPEPPEVRRLQEQWREATAGTTGRGAVDAWRRFVTQQQTGGET